MTQHEDAVGGTDEPIIAAEPTIEDRFAAIMEQPEEEQPPAPAEDDDPPVIEAEDEGDAPEVEEAPAIKPPVSWDDEAKARFAELPPDLQEVVTQREAEREKFIQSKSREAREVAQQAEQAAMTRIEQAQAAQLQLLQSMLPEIPQKPSAHLQYQDPQAYAYHMDAHEAAVAQHNWIVQQAEAINADQAERQQAAQRQHIETLTRDLQEAMPEYFDPATGPELRATLQSTAESLGFTTQEMAQFEAHHYRALKEVTDLKAKADKYDALMAKQMEKVREAKKLPAVSKPGAPRGKGAVANERYMRDRQAMRNGDRDATARVFDRFI